MTPALTDVAPLARPSEVAEDRYVASLLSEMAKLYSATLTLHGTGNPGGSLITIGVRKLYVKTDSPISIFFHSGESGSAWVNTLDLSPYVLKTAIRTDARIQELINATSLADLQGQVTDAQIPASIFRDSELTAAAVRTLLGLTATEVNDLVTGGTLNGSILTFTQNDGSTITITLPTTGGSTADGVVTSGVFSGDGSTLTLTLDTGGTVTIDVPALLETTNTEIDARVQAAKGTVAPGNTPGTPAPGTDDVWSPTDHDHGITVPTTSGLDQAAVDARVQAGVEDWAETSNTDLIPEAKLPATSLTTQTITGTTRMGTPIEQSPLVANTGVSGEHGLGVAPTGAVYYIECITAEQGYAIGDKVPYGRADRGTFWWNETMAGWQPETRQPFITERDDQSDSDEAGVTRANWKAVLIAYVVEDQEVAGLIGPQGDGLNTSEVQELINATDLSALQGMVTNDQIPAAIMRDAELTAAAVRTLLGLTFTEVNDLVTGGSLTGSVLTFTQNDGTTLTITLPTTGESTADGVVASGVFNTDQTELILTLDTGGTVTIDVPAALRVEGLTARAINILSERADSDVHSNAIFPAVYNGVIHKYEFVDIITLARSSAGLGNMLNPLPTTNNVGEYPRQTASGYELVDPGEVLDLSGGDRHEDAEHVGFVGVDHVSRKAYVVIEESETNGNRTGTFTDVAESSTTFDIYYNRPEFEVFNNLHIYQSHGTDPDTFWIGDTAGLFSIWEPSTAQVALEQFLNTSTNTVYWLGQLQNDAAAFDFADAHRRDDAELFYYNEVTHRVRRCSNFVASNQTIFHRRSVPIKADTTDLENRLHGVEQTASITYGINVATTERDVDNYDLIGNGYEAEYDLTFKAARLKLTIPTGQNNDANYYARLVKLTRVADDNYTSASQEILRINGHIDPGFLAGRAYDLTLASDGGRTIEIGKGEYWGIAVQQFLGERAYAVGSANVTEVDHIHDHVASAGGIKFIGKLGVNVDFDDLTATTNMFSSITKSIRMEIDYEASVFGLAVVEKDGVQQYVGKPHYDFKGAGVAVAESTDGEKVEVTIPGGGVGGDDQIARDAAAAAQAEIDAHEASAHNTDQTARNAAAAAQTTANAAQTSNEVDTTIATHAGDADAHHTKYTDADVDARLLDRLANVTRRGVSFGDRFLMHDDANPTGLSATQGGDVRGYTTEGWAQPSSAVIIPAGKLAAGGNTGQALTRTATGQAWQDVAGGGGGGGGSGDDATKITFEEGSLDVTLTATNSAVDTGLAVPANTKTLHLNWGASRDAANRGIDLNWFVIPIEEWDRMDGSDAGDGPTVANSRGTRIWDNSNVTTVGGSGARQVFLMKGNNGNVFIATENTAQGAWPFRARFEVHETVAVGGDVSGGGGNNPVGYYYGPDQTGRFLLHDQGTSQFTAGLWRLPWKSASADEAFNEWDLDIFDGVDRTTLDATFTPGGTVLTFTGQTRDVFKPPSGRYNIRMRLAYFHDIGARDFLLYLMQNNAGADDLVFLLRGADFGNYDNGLVPKSQQAQIADISETDIVFDGNTQLYLLAHIEGAIQCAWAMKLERTGDA